MVGSDGNAPPVQLPLGLGTPDLQSGEWGRTLDCAFVELDGFTIKTTVDPKLVTTNLVVEVIGHGFQFYQLVDGNK